MSSIILLANDKPGALVAKFLKESGDEIIRLYLHEESSQKYSNEIINNSNCSEIFYAQDLKKQGHAKDIKKLNADFIITVYWAYLLKPSVFNAVGDTVNFHPAYLPINRGWYPHVHSIIDGSKLGVTLHRIDEGADTGPIWAQKEIKLLPRDTAKTIYEKLQYEIVELFKQNWTKIKTGKLEPINQNNSIAKYHKKSELIKLDYIDLEENIRVQDLINLLKARSFGDFGFAYFIHNGEKIYLNLRLSTKTNFSKESTINN